MARLDVPKHPNDPLDAVAAFHADMLPVIRAALVTRPDYLVLVFPPAQQTHRGWRLATIQDLAREFAPTRINAVESDDERAIDAALAYLASAEGVTGQFLPLDGNGAGEVLYNR